MKYFLTALLVGVMIQNLWGQTTLRSGYIVKTEGDTLKGFIRDLEWTVNPSQVEYQTSKEGTPQVFTANEIRAFYTSRPILFESHNFRYDAGEQKTNALTYSREPEEWKEEKLFLQVLVKGGISLYRLDDVNGRIHYFIQENTGDVVELLNRKYLVNTNSINQVREFEGWKQQLLNLSASCESASKSIQAARYMDSSLKKIIENLNACRGESVKNIVSVQSERKPSRFGIMVQPFFDYTEISNARTTFEEINFGFGISYEIFSRKKPERISYYNELKYKMIAQTGVATNNNPVNFDFQTINLINMIRFNTPGKAAFFWNLGTNISYRMNMTVQYENGSDLPGNYESDLQLGIAGGIGSRFLNKEKLKGTIELRYELEQSPFTESTFTGTHALGLIIGFQF
jgi:hypothetical protein